jgi:nicotinamide phosphoribosyltransferase
MKMVENRNNIILATDSYKIGHWQQYPKNTEGVYSYFESRPGAEFPYTVFFGLQDILKKFLVGQRIKQFDITNAAVLAGSHFGSRHIFGYDRWQHIVDDHQGFLPLRIKAVPEGTVVPTGNVLMTVENTCPKCYWLTNAVESLLTHVWYPSTVATLSRHTKEMIARYLESTADNMDGLPFMLHDFGYRGASSHETAAIGGAGHLVNFLGTDTLPAMILAMDSYAADPLTLAFSVPATEHSVMTSLGRDGEAAIVDQLFEEYPEGILSCVADSYNIYDFVEEVCTTYKDRILARDGKFVVRPDSVTPQHAYPSTLVAWILERLWDAYGGEINSKGMKVLDPHIGVIWGDGIDPHGIENILSTAQIHGFSAENLVFGMGGGLLQKVNRDTQRFAFKSSAQKRDGVWHDVYKQPLDSSKASKKGRLMLIKDTLGNYETLPLGDFHDHVATDDLLQVVFEDGKLYNEQTFDEIRERAALTQAVVV